MQDTVFFVFVNIIEHIYNEVHEFCKLYLVDNFFSSNKFKISNRTMLGVCLHFR